MMARLAAALVSGLLFGLGLAVSQMVNPAKVQAFLDIAGPWDPSLVLVMVAGAAVAMVGYQLIFARGKPLFADAFALPLKTEIDARLMIGAVIFGIGWGIAGLCPGPGFASLVFGHVESLFFLGAMGLGLYFARQVA
ncbi:MAG: DUF6691 family protein [Alphaproteobacteria bacterium]|nr:DUF6691 family protein [Alphaproteobacteria bacterium]